MDVLVSFTVDDAVEICAFECAYMELVQVRGWRGEFELLRLEGFSNFSHCSQDPQTRVQIGFLQSCAGEGDA